MKMKQIADKLAKHDNTVRNWADWYGEFLSPAPPRGEVRFFTDDDFRVLSYVNELSSKGLGRQTIYEAIKAKFDSNTSLPPVPPDRLLDPDVQQTMALALQDAKTELILKQAEVKELSATVNELREQIHYLRTMQEQERSQFNGHINELMDKFNAQNSELIERYLGQADRFGERYASEVARLREQIGQLTQQVKSTDAENIRHQEEANRLNQIIDALNQRFEQLTGDGATSEHLP